MYGEVTYKASKSITIKIDSVSIPPVYSQKADSPFQNCHRKEPDFVSHSRVDGLLSLQGVRRPLRVEGGAHPDPRLGQRREDDDSM